MTEFDMLRAAKRWAPVLEQAGLNKRNHGFLARYAEYHQKTVDTSEGINYLPCALVALDHAMNSYPGLEFYLGQDIKHQYTHTHKANDRVYRQLPEIEQERYLGIQEGIAVKEGIAGIIGIEIANIRTLHGTVATTVLVQNACETIKQVVEKSHPISTYVVYRLKVL